MASILWILAVVSFACTGHALPANWNWPKLKGVGKFEARNAMLERLVLSLLEGLRQDMVTGGDTMPVLDPYHLELLEVDGGSFGLPGSHIHLEEFQVRNLSSFSVDKLSITMTNIILQRYRVLLDISIPTIEVESKAYDLFIGLMGYKVFGAGSLDLSLVNPTLKANILVGARLSITGIYLSIIETEIIFDLEAFKTNIEGLFNNEYASEFANRFLGYLVPDLIEEYQAEITITLSKLVKDVGNDLLKDLNLIDLIA